MVQVIDPIVGLDQPGDACLFQQRPDAHQARGIAGELGFPRHPVDQGVAGNGELAAAQSPGVGDGLFAHPEQVRQFGCIGQIGPVGRELRHLQPIVIHQFPDV